MKIKVGFLVFIFCSTISFHVFPSNKGFRIVSGKNRTVVPIQLIDNLVIFPVLVNDSEVLNFVLDSGVRSIVIFSKALKNISSLEKGRVVEFGGIGTNLIKGRLTHNISLKINDVEGSGVSAVVINKNNGLFSALTNKKIHGIIGYELLSKFVVEIDYAKRNMILTDPDYFIPDESLKIIPLSIIKTKPFISSSIELSNEQVIAGDFLVDTGSNACILIKTDYNYDPLNTSLHPSFKIGRGMSGTIKGFRSQVKEVKFGEVTFEDVNAVILGAGWYDNTELVSRKGSIGSCLLAKFSVTFDYFNEKLYLK